MRSLKQECTDSHGARTESAPSALSITWWHGTGPRRHCCLQDSGYRAADVTGVTSCQYRIMCVACSDSVAASVVTCCGGQAAARGVTGTEGYRQLACSDLHGSDVCEVLAAYMLTECSCIRSLHALPAAQTAQHSDPIGHPCQLVQATALHAST